MVKEYNGSNLIDDGLLYFYSAYSSKCNIFIDSINKIFNKNPNSVIRINITKYPELKQKYSVKKVPDFIIIKNGNIVSRTTGVIDSYSLERWINKYL